MMIVRYCNNRGQIIDQVVFESNAFATFEMLKKQFGQADLIYIDKNQIEFCLA